MTRLNLQLFSLGLAMLVQGCGGGVITTAYLSEPDSIGYHSDGPAGAAPGTCWGVEFTPAVIETVTEDILVAPASTLPDGTPQPPVYRTTTRQEIVQDRGEQWFETPCEKDLTPDFIASLQRALELRGYLRGNPDGVLDIRTKRAIQSFQRDFGLDSDVLSMRAARQLGLVAYGREEFGVAETRPSAR
ncbi:peptidoglycan-binding domain-containing protein [Donghicola eburneus]|uniref:Putative peptidoglycan-binding protein n=1 Tax=Donghicola eburneus TaxID=393278 RepID=A0A1M4N3R8_9RHOB|nr:peptidoglycan-binding domain-containing protein [Donghicola eburneus]SCM68575.1 putative peptidoglycan-binding protein [Donghicola eburneus]SFQ27549.1 Putative peptidoglycan binding domain-containing protein [Donghicola eburneus]